MTNQSYTSYQDNGHGLSSCTESVSSGSLAPTNSSGKNMATSPSRLFTADEINAARSEIDSSIASTDLININSPPGDETWNGVSMEVMINHRQIAEVAQTSSALPCCRSAFRPAKPGNLKIDIQIKGRRPQNYLRLVTVDIAKAYTSFSYNSCEIPRRVLTYPGKPTRNDGADNENDDYIIRVNEVLGKGDMQVIDILGRGMFGQVVKCEQIQTKKLVCVKIIKNRREYAKQGYMEVDMLQWLQYKVPVKDQHHILQLYDSFHHRNHLCITYELLSYNLHDLLKHNKFRGLPINMVRVFTVQLLETLVLLKDATVIHCDIKPSNILLKRAHSPEIKIADYGSAIHDSMSFSFPCMQTRNYRAPEVILGNPYTYAVDMWSLGCTIAELFIGVPLLPGTSDAHQLTQITNIEPPPYMLENGTRTMNFSNPTQHMIPIYYNAHQPKVKLVDVIINYDDTSPGGQARHQTFFQTAPIKSLSQEELSERLALADFLQGLLTIDPLKRWTPMQAMQHPFVIGNSSRDPFVGLSDVPTVTEKQSRPLDHTNTTIDSMSIPLLPAMPADTQANLHPLPIKQAPKEISTPFQSPIVDSKQEPQASATIPSALKQPPQGNNSGSILKTKNGLTTATTSFSRPSLRKVKIDPMVEIKSYQISDEILSITSAEDLTDDDKDDRATSFYKHNNTTIVQLRSSDNSLSSNTASIEDNNSDDNASSYRTLKTDQLKNSYWRGRSSSWHAGETEGGSLMIGIKE
ncbi:kinase-like domain-containing protein [Dichotomocladium elegans]|nr:kinase-like domain-containing protein [Dichotomocladium elegans]